MRWSDVVCLVNSGVGHFERLEPTFLKGWPGTISHHQNALNRSQFPSFPSLLYSTGPVSEKSQVTRHTPADSQTIFIPARGQQNPIILLFMCSKMNPLSAPWRLTSRLCRTFI
ncbi:hypothetical protein RRG08_056208 [Elysia crispata]|uniref:Uncharacterized protein n=1 Tax=Elysia crispata TaxID=231223 RepID=A0AAE1D0C9_9GAST|nr:hypothetical protein RRG08_056208 [Elysia crispata]